MGQLIKRLKEEDGISYRTIERVWGLERKKLKKMEEEGGKSNG